MVVFISFLFLAIICDSIYLLWHLQWLCVTGRRGCVKKSQRPVRSRPLNSTTEKAVETGLLFLHWLKDEESEAGWPWNI
jgi:hypothetical protein